MDMVNSKLNTTWAKPSTTLGLLQVWMDRVLAKGGNLKWLWVQQGKTKCTLLIIMEFCLLKVHRAILIKLSKWLFKQVIIIKTTTSFRKSWGLRLLYNLVADRINNSSARLWAQALDHKLLKCLTNHWTTLGFKLIMHRFEEMAALTLGWVLAKTKCMRADTTVRLE